MTFAETLYDLISEPGSSLKLLPVIKAVCLLIVLLSCTMIYQDIAAFHMYVLIFLACGLWGSVWFLTVALEEAGGAITDKEALKNISEGKKGGGKSD